VSTPSTSASGVVYLLHFDRPYRHAKHYIGYAASSGFLKRRLAAHERGQGAWLLEVVHEAGIGWQLARTWPGTRARGTADQTPGRRLPMLPHVRRHTTHTAPVSRPVRERRRARPARPRVPGRKQSTTAKPQRGARSGARLMSPRNGITQAVPEARRGDVVIAYADDGRTANYEFGVVTRVRGGLIDAWRTTDGAIRPARFVPCLRYRWLIPQTDINVTQAVRAAAERGGRFTSMPQAREAMRPWLRSREHQMEAGN
jgi:hypothetical protein